MMRYLLFVLVLVCAVTAGCWSAPSTVDKPPSTISPSTRTVSDSDDVFARAFEQRARNLQVEGKGVVLKVLADDNDGSRHQRFVVTLPSGQTLLIAHNIDLAPRIVGLREGDMVSFNGEYEWNPEGGVIHWTHLDASNRHPHGWIRHNDNLYQ